MSWRHLRRKHPAETSSNVFRRISAHPIPILAQTNSLELLNVKPFPASGGEDSRLFGESWDSTNLYWARLADEMGYSPVMLNRLVPELTRRMVSKDFCDRSGRLVSRTTRYAGDRRRVSTRQGCFTAVASERPAIESAGRQGRARDGMLEGTMRKRYSSIPLDISRPLLERGHHARLHRRQRPHSCERQPRAAERCRNRQQGALRHWPQPAGLHHHRRQDPAEDRHI